MKKLLASALTVVATVLLIGCASSERLDNIRHTLEIKTVGEPTEIRVENPRDRFEKPNSPYLSPTMMTMIDSGHSYAFIAIFSGLSTSNVKNLWQDIMYIQYETEIKQVKLFINSGGGGAFAGLALADLIIRAQVEYGISFEANASGIIASAAVPPFTVCDYRIAAPGTIFMVHEAALWKWPGRETSSDIRAQNDLMILLQDRYLGYLVDRSRLTLSQWQAMERATTWFSAEKALKEVGIVDEIR